MNLVCYNPTRVQIPDIIIIIVRFVVIIYVILFVLQGVQIGMGPGGELRYPSFSPQEPNLAWSQELGEFQCYDKVGRRFRFRH